MAVIAAPALRYVNIYTYKDKSYGATPDKAQVPVSVTVAFYRQGATVKVTTTGIDTTTPKSVPVYNTGMYEVDDTIIVDANASTVFVVTAVDVANNTITIKRQSGTATAVNQWSRLMMSSRRPQLYADAGKNITRGADVATNAVTGRLEGYVAEFRYDYAYKIAEESQARVFCDMAGSFVMR